MQSLSPSDYLALHFGYSDTQCTQVLSVLRGMFDAHYLVVAVEY